MKSLVVAALLVGACKDPPAATAPGGVVAPNTVVTPTRDGAAVSPAVAALPGTLWFLEPAPEPRLVRLIAGRRLVIDGAVFPSTTGLPDGRLLAITSRGDGSAESEQLVAIAADGALARLGPAAPTVRDPVADAAGAWVVAAILVDGRSELHRIDLATGAVTRLTDNREGNFHPASLGGDALAFVSSRDGDSELYRGSARGGAAQRLTAFHRDDWEPTPSPDGKTLVFLSDREGPPRLFAMNGDGTGQHRLTQRTDRDATETQPAWSPDGTQLAYLVERAGRAQLWVRDVVRGTERVLTPDDGNDLEPAWSPDGAWIAVARGRAIYAVPVAGGSPVQITSGDPGARLPRWRP